MKKTTALYVTLTLAIAFALALPGMAFGLETKGEPPQEPAPAVTLDAPAADLEKEVVAAEGSGELADEDGESGNGSGGPGGTSGNSDGNGVSGNGNGSSSDGNGNVTSGNGGGTSGADGNGASGDGIGTSGNGNGTSCDGNGTSGDADGNGTSGDGSGTSGDGANGSDMTNGNGGSGSTAGGSDTIAGGSGTTPGNASGVTSNDANGGQADAAGQGSNAPSATSGDALAAPAVVTTSSVSQKSSAKATGASVPAQAAQPQVKSASQPAAKAQAKPVADTKAAAKSAAAAKTAAAAKVATNAQVLKAGTYVLVAGTARGKVLDVEGANKRAGANVIIWTYNGGANQKWTVKYLNGWAVVYGIGGNVLEVAGSKARNGLNVRMGSYRGAANQRWTVMSNADGSVYLASALNSGYRLDITGQSGRDGANVEIWSGNSTKAQKFEAQEANPRVAASAKLAEGWYTFSSALNGSYRLDVTGCNAANGTPLELWSANPSSAQAFRLIKVGQYYRIETGAGAGSYLDVEGGKVVPGTKAEVWRSNTNCALFSLQYEKSLGGYRLVNVASGLALAPTSGKAAKGARVTAERSVAGSKAQTFVLTKRPGLLEEGIYRINTNLAGGRAVSSKGGSEARGAAEVTSTYNGAFTQKWQVKAVPGKTNTYTLESIATGYRLQATANKNVTQQSAANNNAQWWVPAGSNGGYLLRNVRTGQLLDVSGASAREGAAVITWKANGGVNQRWSLSKVAPIESGIYEFRSSADGSYALDVEGSSQANGAKVELWKRNNGANQRWYYDASTGTLVSMSSGKALDVEGANKKSGSKVIQWDLNGGNNQKWTITYDGGGKFKLASKMGNSLVLTAGKAANGSAATSSTDKSSNLQRWKPVKRDLGLSASLKKTFAGVDMTNVRAVGIDVSQWQDTINWGAVKNAGIEFAIIRVGHGTAMSDTQLVANVRGARAAGVKIGLYYYSTATTTAQAKKEASHALSLMKQAGATPSALSYPVYYDLEESNMASTSNRKLLANMASTFLGTMKSNGYKTGVYANLNWWNNYLTDSSFNNYERWVAQWRVARCAYSGPYKVWQCSSDGSVPGITGRVDLDVMY